MSKGRSIWAWAMALGVAGVSLQAAAAAERGTRAPGDLQAMVEADWAAQETRLGRAAGSPEAIRAALERTRLLLADLGSRPDAPDLKSDAAALESLRAEAGRADSLDEAGRLSLYQKARSLARSVALKNPLLASRPIAFMKRKRFAC